ncbi:MAG TPA: hypothetical protein VMI31_03400 [Fimbriimonadaceae bacterium]|nr:hypothetical protein [Fimbriimonadaceae bacterium]
MVNPYSRLLTLSVFAVALGALAHGDLLFDRGLPTANLNNPAGAERSNVAWGFNNTGSDNYFSGDDFVLGGSGAYDVTGITTWIVGNGTEDLASQYSQLTLWLGTAGFDGTGAVDYDVSPFTTSYTATRVTYADGEYYQSSSGNRDQIWQIDWTISGLTLNANTFEDFGVSGLGLDGGVATVFNHASNAALGGAQADGADNLFFDWNNGAADPPADNSDGNGWDKGSDINVRVYGHVAGTPEPFSMSLGLAGIGLFLRRKMKAKKA